MKKENIIFSLLLIVFISLVLYVFIDFNLYVKNNDIKPPKTEYREPLTFETKNMQIYVKDIWIKRNTNVLKKDIYFIETDENNCPEKLYIDKETYLYLKENLKEPGFVEFSCEVKNGYSNKKNYDNFINKIYSIAK